MGKTNKKLSIVLSLFLTLILILGTFTSTVFAENNSPTVEFKTSKEELKDTALDKLDREVLNDFDSEDYIEVLVYLKDQVDTQMVANATKNAVSSTMTPYMTKLEVRKAVVEALKDKAEKTQVNLLKYIEQEKGKEKVVEYTPYYIVNMVYVKATKEVIENISYMPEVEKIYKNKFHEIEKPIKTSEKNQDAVEGLEWNIERVGANLVWDMGIDGTGAVIGLIDTGATWDHPALKEKWRGYDKATGTTNPEGNWLDTIDGRAMPYDIPSVPHGSHVLGTILGQEPDGSNKIGVAPGAKWIAAKAFSEEGGYDNDLITAGQWMLAPGGDPTKAPDVVNNSWGGGAEIDDWFRGVVNSWRAAGIVPVFAAGNQKSGEPAPWPGSIENPGNYPESFSVAATDKNNIRASFSKLGPSLYDDKIIKPEISAPGVGIRSSVPGGYEGGWSGTSMATPHIVGTVALLVSANSSLTVEQIEEIIENTATPLTDGTYPESPNFGYGYGLVNTFDAVSATAAGRGTIKGKVLAEGEDLEEPVTRHEQIVTEAYAGSNIEITANISDDISILEAELLVKSGNKSYWVMVPMNRISGDHKNGVYKANITYDLIEEPGLVYKIRVRDYGGNTVVTDDYNIEVKFGIEPGDYKKGFENNPVGWIFDGAWEWGVPSGASPKPFEGEKLAGTILNGTYPSNANSWLITPPIDLRDENIESATLRFHEWYETENNYDKGYVLITNDYGENWTQVGPIRTGDGKTWKEAVVNLADYAGSEAPVFVAFRLTSDGSVNKTGWYIDNVRIMGVDNESPAIPLGLTAEPSMTGVKLRWQPVPDGDLSHYNVYRSSTSGEGFEQVAEASTNDFTDTTAQAGETYYYKIAAVDFSGNISEFSEEVSAKMPEVETIFSADFEADNGDFTTGTTAENDENPWEWGVPTSGPMGATSGEKLWATNLSGNYNKNTDAYIQSPTIELPEDKDPYLTFNHWTDMEGTSTLYDYGQVLISKDNGATWTNITPVAGGKYGRRVQAWASEEISLKAYKGEDIILRFFFHSDGSGQYDGWYIDDVYVVGTEPLPEPEPGEEVEIAYDDGTAEDALVLNAAGNGLAVKFTPSQYGKVKGANVYLWSNDWPEPGGNRLGFTIYDANGIQVGTTIYVNNLVRGDWNYIDLSSLNFSTTGDFYISTMQDAIGTSCPGVGLDNNTSSDWSKSYLNIGGQLSPLADEGYYDTIMIRAKIDYSVSPSEVTNNVEVKPVERNNKPIAIDMDIMSLWSDEAEVKKPDYKDPEEPKFSLLRDKVNNYEIIEDGEIGAKTNGIPVDAVVTVLETGKSVRTNPATGEYELKHAANEEGQMWTLRTEAYGYYPQEAKVYLEDEETVNQNFRLEAIPQGTIVGQVFDRFSKDPAANAVIRIKEDPRIAPVVANENGNFTIPNVYEGEYTLKVIADGFEPGEANVTVLPNQETQANIGLKRFIGYEEEIGYDDGTGENALVLNAVGNGLAIRVTPNKYGKVKATNIYFWDSSWPSPGGNEIGIAIFDADANGNPAKMVGKPKIVNVERGEWNLIDLSEYGFATDRDFFIATVQTKIGDNSPGTGIDESSSEPGRSYLHVGGEDFEPLADEDVDGGLMIRTIMEYSVSTPEITNLKDINYTNRDKITVEGTVGAEGKVKVYVNDNEPIGINTQDRRFSAEIDLVDEETTIMVSAEMDGKETEPSAPVKVIKDKMAPTLEITTPLDEEKVNVELVHVIGNVFDNHFDKLLIDGNEVALDEEGNFHERVIVYEGENTITISAFDLAGNETTVERKVYVKLEVSTIENIEPAEDFTYEAGDVLTVSFMAETGGKGYFRIAPSSIGTLSLNSTGIPMEESEETPGLYEGTWTIPEGFTIVNGLIEVEFIDAAGNTVTAVAPGRITVLSKEEPQPEIPVITSILPRSDTSLTEGEVLEISFNAPAEGEGYFMITLPFGIAATDNGIRMTEETPGFYKGTWTVPKGLRAKDLTVDLLFTSKEGITVTATATGKVSIVEPVPEGESMENLPVNAVIVGNEAFNIRYLNSNSDAQTKLINWFNGKNPVYIKLSKITIVDISGLEVEIEVLPERIMYYDANGNTTVYIK